MRLFKRIINWFLIKLKIKKPNMDAFSSYQRSSLAYLLNIQSHISTAHIKFKDFDKINEIDKNILPDRFKGETQ